VQALSVDAAAAERLRAARILELEAEAEALRVERAATAQEHAAAAAALRQRAERAEEAAAAAAAGRQRAEAAAGDAAAARGEAAAAAARCAEAEGDARELRELAAAARGELERERGAHAGARALLEAATLAAEGARREAEGLRGEAERLRRAAADAEGRATQAAAAGGEARARAEAAEERARAAAADGARDGGRAAAELQAAGAAARDRLQRLELENAALQRALAVATQQRAAAEAAAAEQAAAAAAEQAGAAPSEAGPDDLRGPCDEEEGGNECSADLLDGDLVDLDDDDVDFDSQASLPETAASSSLGGRDVFADVPDAVENISTSSPPAAAAPDAVPVAERAGQPMSALQREEAELARREAGLAALELRQRLDRPPSAAPPPWSAGPAPLAQPRPPEDLGSGRLRHPMASVPLPLLAPAVASAWPAAGLAAGPLPPPAGGEASCGGSETALSASEGEGGMYGAHDGALARARRQVAAARDYLRQVADAGGRGAAEGAASWSM
jgi:hypothetical protein